MNAGGTISLADGFRVTVGGAAGAAGGEGRLNIQGGLLNATGKDIIVRSAGTVNLSSGELRLGNLIRTGGSQFNFTAGKLNFTGSKILDADLLAAIFNDNAELTANNVGMTLQVTGAASLSSPLRLNGGTFSVGSIGDLSNLDWDRGTLALTAMDVNIESGGLFGDQLLLQNEQNLTVSQSATNNGLINATGASLSFGAGLTNNADVVLVNSSISGPLTSPGSRRSPS